MPTSGLFFMHDELSVPAVTAEEMRQIDEIAVGQFGLGILQMMENAGRALAKQAMDMFASATDAVVVLAGAGGNGGGGLCSARHLHNRGFPVIIGLGVAVEALRGPALAQWQTLRAAGIRPAELYAVQGAIREGALVVDALVGYGLRGALRGRIADLVSLCHDESARVLSLDVPSGWDATSGTRGPVAIDPERILTLALPKTGLSKVQSRICLANLGIPKEVYAAVGIHWQWPSRQSWIDLAVVDEPRMRQA